MKAIFLFLLLFFQTHDHLLQTTSDFQTALENGQKQNKAVLVMIARNGCPVCDYMTDTVFEEKEVIAYLDTYFVTVIKYIHKDAIEKRFTVEHTPTFFFINPHDQKELRNRKVGGAKPEKFLEILQEVHEGFHSQTLHNQFATMP